MRRAIFPGAGRRRIVAGFAIAIALVVVGGWPWLVGAEPIAVIPPPSPPDPSRIVAVMEEGGVAPGAQREAAPEPEPESVPAPEGSVTPVAAMPSEWGAIVIAEAAPEAPLVPFLGEDAPAPVNQASAEALQAVREAPSSPPAAQGSGGSSGASSGVGPGGELPANFSGFKNLYEFFAYLREKMKVNFVLDARVPQEKINQFVRFEADESVDLRKMLELVLQKHELAARVLNSRNLLIAPARKKLGLVELKRAKPEDVEQAITGLDAEFAGKVKAVPGTTAVRVTAFEWQMDPIMSAIRQMDTFAQDRHTRTYVLDYVPPELIAAQLTKFFGTTLTIDTDKISTITVSGSSSRLQEAEALIRSLDRPRPHALIQFRLVEATADQRDALGLETPDGLGVEFDAQNSRLSLLPKISGTNARLFNAGTFMNLRQEKGSVRVVAAPQVRLVEKEKATVQIGRKLPVRLRTAARSAAGDNVELGENIQFIEDGLKLDMELQKINAKGELTLKMLLDVIVVDERGRDGVPIQSNRATASVIRVANNDTVVIGGFVNQQEVHRLREIPLFSRVPFLGRLFTRQNQEGDKRDLLLLMTPHVLGAKGGS